ncbi:MAG TPA: MgtC/SapB family protein [Pirellulales bacterium]|nr:MgtC/SapB family protein [Pirellulales bacterium]
MPTELGWNEIAVRLGLAAATGFVIGFNRERGHAAGLRTTLLVCLAATVAMIQANLLLNTVGKRPDSFIVLDLMRLPLGILSGMGFIGAGAIFRRKNMSKGVTTAATLWFVTVMGLCFGGGQLMLGLAAFVLGIITLSVLRHLENWLAEDQRARLTLVAGADGPETEDIRRNLSTAGYRVESLSIAYAKHAAVRRLTYDIRWRGRKGSTAPPDVVEQLAKAPGVSRLEWKPGAAR